MKDKKQRAEKVSQRRAAAYLQKSNDELEQTQAQWIRSAKLAAVGDLVAGIAHEINNPLCYVMGNIRALKEYRVKLEEYLCAVSRETTDTAQKNKLDALSEKLRIASIMKDIPTLIEQTLEGAERINRIVLGLRTFARPDGGEAALLDINQNIDVSLLLVISELKYKAEIVKEYGTIPPLSGYAQQLSQVFVNILMNAAQSIDTSGRITIRTYTAGEKAVVEISDTGCGIPPKNAEKLFTPFFTTKDVGKGTGLGLPIAYGIIKRHKGTIEVKSEVGKGTTFTICLPYKI